MTATINASTSAGVVTTADTSGILQLQTNGTAALTVDASQNVGIGTASPSQKLTVAGAGTAARLEVINTSDTNRGGYLRDTGSTFELGTNSGVRPLAFAFDGSEKMRIDSSGNVVTLAVRVVLQADGGQKVLLCQRRVQCHDFVVECHVMRPLPLRR